MTTESGKVPKTAIERLGGKTRKGAPNKQTKQLKDMILAALDKSGGVDYLFACAQDPKLAGAFLSLVGKVLPMTVQGPGDKGEFITAIEWQVVKAEA